MFCCNQKKMARFVTLLKVFRFHKNINISNRISLIGYFCFKFYLFIVCINFEFSVHKLVPTTMKMGRWNYFYADVQLYSTHRLILKTHLIWPKCNQHQIKNLNWIGFMDIVVKIAAPIYTNYQPVRWHIL